ncbi:hypothetical protein DERP_005017 [Dermatophagoides pteronyssinus]|uniref:Uncharacterized protein n=1 Tax=Dermatophagoides pteronyssinus TaxID=6956 RepID=A0ABQ8JT38_DERPT|nr:hypothetical protein DERP_005017 [Dermatophagoides pteronyssinus]
MLKYVMIKLFELDITTHERKLIQIETTENKWTFYWHKTLLHVKTRKRQHRQKKERNDQSILVMKRLMQLQLRIENL